MKNGAVGSIICGVIMNVINIAIVAIMFLTGTLFIAAKIMIVFPIVGIISGAKSITNGGGILGIVGIVLNVIATIGSAGLLILYFML